MPKNSRIAGPSNLVLLLLTVTCSAQSPQLLIRCDDIGMTHAVNQAFQKVLATGLPVSASVMFACPWYQEAVAILKNHPEVSVGVHLTLNAEWQNYRWGPISRDVLSLCDSLGYFFPSQAALHQNNPSTEEVERELRAQIVRALHSGLKIDYIDYHMGTAISLPEWRSIVEKLAYEYHLGISRYFGEIDVQSHYSLPVKAKLSGICQVISQLPADKINLSVFHIGLLGSEMDALIDLNPHGLKNMSAHRQAELDALTSPKLRRTLIKHNVQLLTYRDLIKQRGLENMRAPQ
jgi:predicted glycoside hydrolase/deacetylase ChbG (UPF0249 family)